MDSRRKQIDLLGTDINRLEQQVTSECVNLGRRIAELPSPSEMPEEITKYLRSIRAFEKTSASARAEIDRIREKTHRIETLSREIEETQQRREEIEKERRAKFSDLGAGAFSLYQGLPADEQEHHRASFEDLLKLRTEIDRVQDELQDLKTSREGKGVFQWLRLKGRDVMRRGEVTRLEREKDAAYERAAERLVGTDFVHHARGSLKEMFTFAEQRRSDAEKLTLENDARLEEIEHCRADLKGLSAENNGGERIQGIESRIEGMDKELEVLHCWAGQSYLDRDLRESFGDDGIAAKFEIVQGMRESIKEKLVQVHRLKAELELEELAAREKMLRAKRTQIEEERRVKERQIDVVDIEINLGLKRMEELRRMVSGDAPYEEAPPPPPVPDLYPRES